MSLVGPEPSKKRWLVGVEVWGAKTPVGESALLGYRVRLAIPAGREQFRQHTLATGIGFAAHSRKYRPWGASVNSPQVKRTGRRAAGREGRPRMRAPVGSYGRVC